MQAQSDVNFDLKSLGSSSNFSRESSQSTDDISSHIIEDILNSMELPETHTPEDTLDDECDLEYDSLLEYIDINVIGRETVVRTPYGLRNVIYCDYTASGRPLVFIEEYISQYVYAMYANTHTTTTSTSRQTTQFRHEARDIIKKCVNASEDDVVIFTGSGTTGAIHKLIAALQLNNNMEAYNTVVIVGPYEHHSNILPWKESGVRQIIRIRDTSKGQVDMKDLESRLQYWSKNNVQVICALSAASNVTGIITDTIAVAELVHKHNGLSLWDYATAAPYLKIDMNASEMGYKDAVFCSPHKFVGGPGTPGVLIAKKKLFRNPVPHGCGGGTVLFVTRDTHLYLKDIEAREEGGTPAIIESIRAGMVFQLKREIGTELIEQKEQEMCESAFNLWKKNPNMKILGSHSSRRLPIFSFLVLHQDTGKFLHHNFVSVLLNDLYGIQARGGCACAGPYAQDLLGLDEETARKFTWFLDDAPVNGETHIKQALEIMKPGFVRLNFPYFFSVEYVDFILEAVDMVCKHGWKLLPQYTYDPRTGAWEHRLFDYNHDLFSLHNIHYGKMGMVVEEDKFPFLNNPKTLDEIAADVQEIFDSASRVSLNINTLEDPTIDIEDTNKAMIWFLEPREAQINLALEKLKHKPISRNPVPFTPRIGSRKVLMQSDSVQSDSQLSNAWRQKRHSAKNLSFWMKHGKFHTQDTEVVAHVQGSMLSTGQLPTLVEGQSSEVYVLNRKKSLKKMSENDMNILSVENENDSEVDRNGSGTVTPKSGTQTPGSSAGSPKGTRAPTNSVDHAFLKPFLTLGQKPKKDKCVIM